MIPGINVHYFGKKIPEKIVQTKVIVSENNRITNCIIYNYEYIFSIGHHWPLYCCFSDKSPYTLL
jgi:hypothetical protein